MTSTAPAVSEQVCVTVGTRIREVLDPIVCPGYRQMSRHIDFSLWSTGHRTVETDSVLK